MASLTAYLLGTLGYDPIWSSPEHHLPGNSGVIGRLICVQKSRS